MNFTLSSGSGAAIRFHTICLDVSAAELTSPDSDKITVLVGDDMKPFDYSDLNIVLLTARNWCKTNGVQMTINTTMRGWLVNVKTTHEGKDLGASYNHENLATAVLNACADIAESMYSDEKLAS